MRISDQSSKQCGVDYCIKLVKVTSLSRYKCGPSVSLYYRDREAMGWISTAITSPFVNEFLLRGLSGYLLDVALTVPKCFTAVAQEALLLRVTWKIDVHLCEISVLCTFVYVFMQGREVSR